MIPRTTARRLETTLVSCSRQSLPRPARFQQRLYSSPTQKNNAQALAHAPTHPTNEYVSYVPPSPSDTSVSPTAAPDLSQDLQSFLHRRPQFTLLPTPLPEDKNSAINDFYFPDSPTQDLLAVMDACLHGLYDVPRAKQVFESMRERKQGDPILDTRVFNSFLEAYVGMAGADVGGSGKRRGLEAEENKVYWVRQAWKLFGVMESEAEKVVPSAGTYATMLMALTRYISQAK